MRQATLRKMFSLSGIGVHSGKTFSVTVFPADEDFGIQFHRTDIDWYISANWLNVQNATMCTQLTNNSGETIKTIEHLAASLYAMKISNALIETTGEEIPILDGSSMPYVKAIQDAGITEQLRPRRVLKILKNITVTESTKHETFSPFDDFTIDVECDFTAKGLTTSPAHFNMNSGNFMSEIASARTFGFVEEMESLQKNNLALGASLENAVGYNNQGQPLNKEGLRFQNESAVHKLLDIIGDLSLSEYWIAGKLSAFCPSHNLNNMLLRELFSNTDNYEIIE
ncbi:MAG: UDP-3-O-[3-hydroxymyristoyl] N-acetylglucosamine deacetylase [Alphaproteobacteria bacterium]|nr:UDP-3-O-[3-hydroxymyristoyl] N-acetylglucosamine deacetylase [Alphaproteobacteria bacterium]